MKNLIYLSLFILAGCGSGVTLTSSYPQPNANQPSPNPVPVNTNPNQQVPNWTTPEPNNNMGIGPVIVSKSNFYFAGDFQIMNGTPLFYDCMAGANIPIATDKGIYQEVASRYNSLVTNQGDILRAQFRGYFVDEPTSDYPKKLVISYINDLAAGPICERQKELPGNWSASLIGSEKGSVTLSMTNTFDFTCEIVTNTGTEKISGSWMMTSGQEIVLFYTTVSRLMGHSIAFNPNNMTLFIPTQSGTLIFKKQ
ncbi:MAG: hypothetical protein RR346_09880 [Bacteroidales bacterium]